MMAITREVGQDSMRATCSKDWAEGMEIVDVLKVFLTIAAMPPPFLSVCQYRCSQWVWSG